MVYSSAPVVSCIRLVASLHPLPAKSDDTGSNELLDVGLDARVLHVLLESSWVALGLLQDRLHDGICL